MDVKSFNETHFSEVILKITNEKKVCYLAGDFNISLLKSETVPETKDFFDSLTSNLCPSYNLSKTGQRS